MASAMVTSIRGSNKSKPSMVSCIATCYFSGDDVTAEIEGVPNEIPVTVPIGFTLAALKNEVRDQVIARAAVIGLSVVVGDIDILAFDTPGPP